jgi:hypothetical protein
MSNPPEGRSGAGSRGIGAQNVGPVSRVSLRLITVATTPTGVRLFTGRRSGAAGASVLGRNAEGLQLIA